MSVSEVVAVARRVLIDVLAERAGLLVDLQASAPLPYPGEL